MSDSDKVNFKKLTSREVFKLNQNRKSPLSESFIVWLHNIRSAHNVGAVFRSADAFGIHRLMLSGYTPSPPDASISKTALGAEKIVKYQKIEESDLAGQSEQLKSKGYRIVGLEQTDRSGDINSYPLKSLKTCLILGNEVTGIDETLFKFIDDMVLIPQYGHKHSLNVSVAAGVALYAFSQKAEDHLNNDTEFS